MLLITLDLVLITLLIGVVVDNFGFGVDNFTDRGILFRGWWIYRPFLSMGYAKISLLFITIFDMVNRF